MEINGMKKHPLFFLALFVVFVFACNLETPKEVHILKETPELRFAATMDSFSLEDIFDMDFDFDFGPSVQILDCENVPTLTKLIYLELFDEDLSTDGSFSAYISSIPAIGFPIPAGGREIAKSPVPVGINAPEVDIGFLKNIKLKPLRTRIYISGSDPTFLDMLEVEISINEGKESENIKKYGSSQRFVFPTGDAAGKYSGTNLPPCINEFYLPFDDDLEIKIAIYLKGGQTIYPTLISKGLDIKVELGIWLPFEFEVGSGGANFELPFDDLFEEDGDLFGRESATDESFIVDSLIYLFLEIVLDNNPFPNATLIVESNSKTIKSTVSGDSLKINIDKENVGYPFAPKFSVEFKEGDTIRVPREFTIKELGFKAKLRVVIDVAGEDS
jgi:hypothetical protein